MLAAAVQVSVPPRSVQAALLKAVRSQEPSVASAHQAMAAALPWHVGCRRVRSAFQKVQTDQTLAVFTPKDGFGWKYRAVAS